MLVVDDNRDSADSLSVLLGTAGNEMRVAYDALEALEVGERSRPEVILLDIGLPKLDGHNVARAIRHLPWGERTVLVALTGWGQHEERQKSKEAGFNGRLVKPVSFDELMMLLAELQLAV